MARTMRKLRCGRVCVAQTPRRGRLGYFVRCWKWLAAIRVSP